MRRVPGGGSTRRPGHGQALVEFILVLPLFLALLLMLIDFGRVLYARNAISTDANAASRLASVSAPQTDAAIRDRARFMSPGVAYPDSAITGEGGLFYPEGSTQGARVVVNITVEVPIVTPIVSQLVGGSITVSVTSEERIH